MISPPWPAPALVLVAVLLTAVGCGDQRTDGATDGGPRDDGSATPPSPGASSQVLDVADLPVGGPPAIAWAQRRGDGFTIRGPAGRTPAPGHLDEFAPMGSGYVVSTVDPDTGTAAVRWIGSDGTPGQGRWRSTPGLSTSPGGSVVAWAGPRGAITVIDQTGDEVLTMPAIDNPSGELWTAGVLGEDCKEGRTTDAGCTVYVNDNGADPTAWLSTSHGIVDRVPGLLRVGAVSEERVAGMIDATDTGSCWQVATAGGDPLWETCDYSLSSFSPDATRLVAMPAYLDGFGPTEVAMLDAETGEVVAAWSHAEGSATYFHPVWESAGSLLLVTYQDGEWAVVRLTEDGSMEYAVQPVAAGEDENPFRLTTR